MRNFHPNPRGGFSLVEMVIVLFLTGAILLAVAKLISQSVGTLKFLQEKSQTMESATLGCERVASELREAVRLQSFTSGLLRFHKVRPSAPEAVGNDYADVTISAEDWKRDYSEINQLAEVVYQVNPDSQLIRTAEGQSGAVATKVNSFVVATAPGVGCFTVTLSIKEARRVIAFKTAVTCPGLQRAFAP